MEPFVHSGGPLAPALALTAESTVGVNHDPGWTASLGQVPAMNGSGSGQAGPGDAELLGFRAGREGNGAALLDPNDGSSTFHVERSVQLRGPAFHVEHDPTLPCITSFHISALAAPVVR